MLWSGSVFLDNEKSAVLGDRKTGQLGDAPSRFGHNIDRWDIAAVGPHRPDEFSLLFRRAEMAARRDEFVAQRLVDFGFGNHRIVSQATGGIIEGLGPGNHHGRIVEVSGFVNDMDGIAYADAIGGRARTVGGLDHAHAAGGDDEVGELHQGFGLAN